MTDVAPTSVREPLPLSSLALARKRPTVRTRAKREDNGFAVASRHVILRQACGGRPIASLLTEIGWCLPSRHSNFGGRPCPDQFLAGCGPVPGAHTDVWGWMPAT